MATFIGNYKLNKDKQWLTVLGALKPGQLEEDCPMKTLSEKKRFSSSILFSNGTIKFKYLTMQTLRILKPLERTRPFRKQPSDFINVIRRFAKKY